MAIIYFYFPGYIFEVAPLALITYDFIKEVPSIRTENILSLLLPALALALFFIKGKIHKFYWVGFIIAAFAVYMLNGGWFYTRFIVLIPLILLCFTLLPSQEELVLKWWKAIKIIPAIAVFIVLFYTSSTQLNSEIEYTKKTGFAVNHNHMAAELYDALGKAAGTHFMLLSTSLWATDIEPLRGAPHSVFAYDYLWPLPWLYANPEAPHAAFVKRSLVNEMLYGLQQKPVLIVDESPSNRGLPRGTNILHYFDEDAAIHAALAQYHLTQTIDTCSNTMLNYCKFSIWQPI